MLERIDGHHTTKLLPNPIAPIFKCFLRCYTKISTALLQSSFPFPFRTEALSSGAATSPSTLLSAQQPPPCSPCSRCHIQVKFCSVYPLWLTYSLSTMSSVFIHIGSSVTFSFLKNILFLGGRRMVKSTYYFYRGPKVGPSTYTACFTTAYSFSSKGYDFFWTLMALSTYKSTCDSPWTYKL